MKRLCISLMLLVFAGTAHAFTGVVEKVSDGDTVIVAVPGNERVKVRLYGIDTPESKQAFGAQAKRFSADMVLHKFVKVQKLDTDKYGRIVALVYTQDGKILNEKLVENGHAWVYEKYCDIDECDAWKEKQDVAMAQQKGLWQDPEPMAPWDYRKSKRN